MGSLRSLFFSFLDPLVLKANTDSLTSYPLPHSATLAMERTRGGGFGQEALVRLQSSQQPGASHLDYPAMEDV